MSDIRKKKNIIVLISVVVYVILYFAFIYRLLPNYAIIINGVFAIAMAAVSYFIYGFQHCELNKVRKKVLLEVLIAVVSYFIIIYIIGIFTGFLKNSYSLEITSIFKNTLFPLLSVIALEIFRYIFISANKDSKEFISYVTMAIILFDIALNFYEFEGTLVALFIFLTVKVLPIVFKNVVLSYLTYQVGYHSCLIFVIPLCICKYLLPYIPDLGNYLNSAISISLVSLIYIYASKIISNDLDGKISKKEIIKLFVIELPLTAIFVILICLTSFKFKYSLIGVDTDLLKTKINKGDLILVKRIDYDEYREKDIIVYKSEDKKVIDTIEKIENGSIYIIYGYDEENEYIYKLIDENMILGKYDNIKISKLGYPTIWFNDFIKGDVNEN